MAVSIKNLNYLQNSASPMAGTAGYLNTILYSALVTGFNSKSITSITVTDNIATVTTSAAHNYTLTDPIKIEGANESIFNDDFQILAVPSSTTFTFSITTELTTATGTITCKIAPLGWTREFTGTNVAVYRAPTGTRHYLRVDDTQALYATVAMYETMTDVNTGTGKSSDVYWKKSNASSTATREWYLIGNSKTFYLMTAWDSSYLTLHTGYAFGEMNSIKSGDTFNTFLIGHSAAAPSNIANNQSFYYVAFNSTYILGHYLIRNSIGTGSIQFFKVSTPNVQFGSGGPAYPNIADNGLHLFPVEVFENSPIVYRGRLPGIYAPMETTSGYFASNDRTVQVNGRTYMAIKTAWSSIGAGNCFFDITGEW